MKQLQRTYDLDEDQRPEAELDIKTFTTAQYSKRKDRPLILCRIHYENNPIY